MKSNQIFTILLALLSFNSCIFAQLAKGTWHLGIGGGPNFIKYDKESFTYSLLATGAVKVSHENSVGFQGNLAVSYQLTRLLQMQSGFGISKVKAYATVNSTSNFPFLGTTTSLETIFQKYLLLDIPLSFRLHLRSPKGSKHGFNAFLEAGCVFTAPVTNKSEYEKWENDIYQGARSIRIKSFSLMNAAGLAIGDYDTIACSWSYLNTDLEKDTDVWKLTFTHYFKMPKKQ